MPVLRGSVLVGIVSRADLMRALAALVEKESLPASALADAEIQKNVLAALAETAWAPRAGVTVAVTDGVVTLEGAITEERQREALRVVAENAPGVREVRDRIVWVEPVFGGVLRAPSDEPAPTASGRK